MHSLGASVGLRLSKIAHFSWPMRSKTIFGERSLRRALSEYVEHFHAERNHQGPLDPEGWQPLIDARPDWFEVIHLYGTKSGWERLKQLSLTRIPLHDTSTLLTGSPPPLATSMPTGSPAAPRRRDRDGQSTRRLLQAATIMPVRIRQEVQALPRGDGRIALSCCSRKIHFVTLVPAQALRPARNALHSFGRFNFLTIRD